MAEALRQLGRERAWVVHGTTESGKGMDDISTNGVTIVADLANGRITSAVMDMRWLGIPESALADLAGGEAQSNAADSRRHSFRRIERRRSAISRSSMRPRASSWPIASAT